MGEMNFLEKLLDGVNVEWRPLSEALNRTKGTKITAAQMRELHKEGAPIKIFAGGKTYAFFDFSDIPKKDINEEPSIIVKSRGFIEFEYYDKPFSHKNEMWSYNANGKQLDIKFVYYFLKVHEPYFQNIGSKMQMPQISIPDTDNFRIPIPCPENPKKSLEIQAEIVRILDAMTAHTAELTAELTARKKQYDYYRDKLLSFEDDVNELPLSDICTSIADGDHQAPPQTNKGISFVTISNISDNGFIDFLKTKYVPNDYYNNLASKRKPQVGDVLYTVVGSIGIPVFIDFEKEFTFQRHIAILRFKPELVNPKYAFHFMRSSKFFNKANSVAMGAAQKTITLGTLGKLKISLPSLDRQNKVVAILDKFDSLANSITEGLPREIELRQKQYAYYRDLLLSFPAAQAA